MVDILGSLRKAFAPPSIRPKVVPVENDSTVLTNTTIVDNDYQSIYATIPKPVLVLDEEVSPDTDLSSIPGYKSTLLPHEPAKITMPENATSSEIIDTISTTLKNWRYDPDAIAKSLAENPIYGQPATDEGQIPMSAVDPTTVSATRGLGATATDAEAAIVDLENFLNSSTDTYVAQWILDNQDRIKAMALADHATVKAKKIDALKNAVTEYNAAHTAINPRVSTLFQNH